MAVTMPGQTRQSSMIGMRVSEEAPLDFHSPYGCSKGAADQYFRDYYRIYGLPTTVFRQSCIYGPRQMGVEDQGWVAWFIIALVTGFQGWLFRNAAAPVRLMLIVAGFLLIYPGMLTRGTAFALMALSVALQWFRKPSPAMS